MIARHTKRAVQERRFSVRHTTWCSECANGERRLPVRRAETGAGAVGEVTALEELPCLAATSIIHVTQWSVTSSAKDERRSFEEPFFEKRQVLPGPIGTLRHRLMARANDLVL